MKHRFEIIASYPKRRFAVYEKKESFFDKVLRNLGIKKKKPTVGSEVKKKNQND